LTTEQAQSSAPQADGIPPTDGAPEAPGAEAATGRASYRSGFAFGTLGFFATTVFGVLSTIVTSRLYGVHVIGQYALVWAPVAAMWVLSSIKEQQALIKEITGLPPRHPRVTQLFAAVFTFSTGLTFTIALLDALVCWFVFRGPLHQPKLMWPAFASIGGYALITNTGWNIDSIFSAFVAGRQLFWVRLHETCSFLTIAIVVGSRWQSVWGLVIATVGASLTSLVHRALWARPFVRTRLSREEYRAGLRVLPELLRFGLKATPGQLAQGISQQGGVWAIGTVAPIAVVGAYSRAQMVPQRLQQASMRITEVLYPTLVGRHTKGDKHGFDRALVDSIRYETIGMLMIAAVIGGSARIVLELFGPGFSRATPALALLALFPALSAVTVTQTQALWATNQPGRTSLIALARVALTLMLLVILTPRIGITGPAIALLSGLVLVIVFSGLSLRASMAQPLRATWPLRERMVMLGAYAAGFASAAAVEHAILSPAGLPVSFGAGALAYALVFLGGGGMNERDRRRLADALAMARAWRNRARAGKLAPIATPAIELGGESDQR
jgi:O-antigen/teichoic acid export membrane protein